jgi:hypothetical protein
MPLLPKYLTGLRSWSSTMPSCDSVSNMIVAHDGIDSTGLVAAFGK